MNAPQQQQQQTRPEVDRYGMDWRFNFRHEQLEAEQPGILFIVAQREDGWSVGVYTGSDESGWEREVLEVGFENMPAAIKAAEAWGERAEWYAVETGAVQPVDWMVEWFNEAQQ